MQVPSRQDPGSPLLSRGQGDPALGYEYSPSAGQTGWGGAAKVPAAPGLGHAGPQTLLRHGWCPGLTPRGAQEFWSLPGSPQASSLGRRPGSLFCLVAEENGVLSLLSVTVQGQQTPGISSLLSFSPPAERCSSGWEKYLALFT